MFPTQNTCKTQLFPNSIIIRDPALAYPFNAAGVVAKWRTLTLAGLNSPIGVPDADPSAQLDSITEPTPGTLRITLLCTASSTGWAGAGVRWDLAAATLASAGFLLDGTMGIATDIEIVSPPAAAENLYVGIGLRGPTVNSGLANGMFWGGGTRRAWITRNDSVGSSSADVALTRGSGRITFGRGSGGAGISTLGGTVDAYNGTTAINGLPAPLVSATAPGGVAVADWRLFIVAGVHPAHSGTTRSIDIIARWAVVSVRPPI